MKKLLKSSLLLTVLAIFLFALTGCGGNKLVATKTEEDSYLGKYEEKIEIKFKKGIASEVTLTMEFEDEDTAKEIMELYSSFGSEEDMEQKGKKIIMKMDVKDIAGSEDEDKLTKEYLKEQLEEEGYTVK